jgi:hypothetical protein
LANAGQPRLGDQQPQGDGAPTYFEDEETGVIMIISGVTVWKGGR